MESNPCALSSFMKLLRAESLKDVNEIHIVDDNAKRRRSSISRLVNALKGGKDPRSRSFRKSQRWESHQAAASPPAPPSSSPEMKEHKQAEPARRRSSGIFCPQRRESIDSHTHNAAGRRSSFSRLVNALKDAGSRCSFRKSQRWETHQEEPPSLVFVADVSKEHEQEEPSVTRRISGIFCPQRRSSVDRRASVERRDSYHSQTSISSSVSFLSASFQSFCISERSEAEPKEEKQPQLPAYGMALKLISQKYAIQSTASSGPNTTSSSTPSDGVFWA